MFKNTGLGNPWSELTQPNPCFETLLTGSLLSVATRPDWSGSQGHYPFMVQFRPTVKIENHRKRITG